MRTFVLISFLVCLIFSICEAKTKCKSNDDCEEDECCTRMLMFNYCQKRKQEGEICITDIEELKEGDVYKFVCPCASGLSCKSTKSQDENGIFNFLKDKCVKE